MNKSKSTSKDSIYGMSVNEDTALHAEPDGMTICFCHDRWRQKFLSTPGAKSVTKSGGC